MISEFGILPDGKTVKAVTIENGPLYAIILTHGASLQTLHMKPYPFSLVLGFPDLAGYLENPWFGAMVGRVANRIANGRFELDGKTYEIDRNERGKQTLHGGSRSIALRNWEIVATTRNSVTLTITDKSEDNGFPGNCTIECTYRIEGQSLVIETSATADSRTVCNIAHHSYFNLSGDKEILDHEFQVAADRYLPTDENQIPTGVLEPVKGSPFDFRELRRIGRPTAEALDHNFCLNNGASYACRLHSPASGISLEIETTQPGLQVFTANGISTTWPGHRGEAYGSFCGIAIEPQHWPDAPNQPNFPDITLNPGETYHEKSVFSFSA